MQHAIRHTLQSFANPHKIPDLQRFFKTAPGEYGEGDRFLGIKVPDIRKVVKQYALTLDLITIKPGFCNRD
jgi:hypothetical protein